MSVAVLAEFEVESRPSRVQAPSREARAQRLQCEMTRKAAVRAKAAERAAYQAYLEAQPVAFQAQVDSNWAQALAAAAEKALREEAAESAASADTADGEQ